MKKLLYIFAIIFSFGCSQDENYKEELPEMFIINVEIIGEEHTPIMESNISVNGLVIYTHKMDYLPLNYEVTYYPSQEDLRKSNCNCIEIKVLSYLANINKIKEYNLYVNGVLVDSRGDIAPIRPDGYMNYTSLSYTY